MPKAVAIPIIAAAININLFAARNRIAFDHNVVATVAILIFPVSNPTKVVNLCIVFTTKAVLIAAEMPPSVDNNMVKVSVSALFGKQTTVELELDQVELAE